MTMEKITLDGVEYKLDDFDNEQKAILQDIIYHNNAKANAQRALKDSSLLLDHNMQLLKANIEAKKKKDDDKKE